MSIDGEDVEETQLVVELTVQMTEAKLDEIWGRLDFETKGAAIQAILGMEDLA